MQRYPSLDKFKKPIPPSHPVYLRDTNYGQRAWEDVLTLSYIGADGEVHFREYPHPVEILVTVTDMRDTPVSTDVAPVRK